MPTNIEIDFSDVSLFKAEIKSFNTSLNTLQNNIVKFSANINTVGSNFKAAEKSFKGIKDAVTGVDTIFRTIATSMASIAKVPNLDTQVAELNKFINAIKGLGATGGTSAKTIASVVNAFSNLSKLQSKGITANVQPLIAAMRDIFELSRDLGKENLSASVKQLQSLITSLKSLASLDTSKIQNIGKQIAAGLNSSDAIAGATAFGENIANAIIAAVNRTLGISSPSTVFKAIGNFVVQGFELGLQAGKQRLANTATQVFTELIREINNLFVSLGAINSSGGSQNIHDILKMIKEVFHELSTINMSGGTALSAKQLKEKTKSIQALANFVGPLANSFRDLNTFSSNDLTKFRTTVRVLLNVFKTFEGFEDTRLTRLIPIFGPRSRLSQVLKGIRPFTKILADALRSFETLNPDSLRAVGNILRSIFQFFNLLRSVADVDRHDSLEQALSIFGRSTRLSKSLKGIKNFTRILADALKAFNKVPSASKLQATVGIIDMLGRVMFTLGGLGKKGFSQSNIDGLYTIFGRSTRLSDALKGIKPFVRVLAEAINELQRIKVRGDVLSGVASFLTSFSQFSTGNFTVNNTFNNITRQFEGGIDNLTNRVGDKSKQSQSKFRKFGQLITDAFTQGFKIGFGNILRDLSRFTSQIEQKFQSLTQNVRNTARGLIQGGLTGIATGGFFGFLQGNIVQLTRTFDAVIKQVGVFGDLTASELAVAQDAILKFSAVTKFGPAESAQAFLDLQKAGLSAASALQTLPSVGAFAVAGQLDLSTSTQLALQSLNGFGLGIESISRVIDTFVGGADISTAGVAELAQALGFVSPSANALAISIEDTTAALALLNDQAITGERAGTGLRAVLDALAAPTDAAQATLDGLGITLADADGNFIGLSGTILQFQSAIENLRAAGAGDLEIIEQLSSLGDRNAISTLLALIKDGSGEMVNLADGSTRAATAFEQYRQNLAEANKASEIAAELSDTIDAALTSLQGSIQTLIITAFQPLLTENIKPIVEVLIDFTNQLTKLPKPVLKTAAALTVIGTVMVTLGGIVAVFSGLILFSLIPALQLAAGAFAILFNPVSVLATGAAIATTFAVAIPTLLLFGSALAFVSGLLFKFYTDVKNNTGRAGDSFKALGQSLSELGKTFGELFDSSIAFFNAFANGSDGVKAGADKMRSSGVADFLNTIRSGVDKITQSLAELKLLFDFFVSRQITSIDTGGNTPEELYQRRIALQEELNAKIAEGGEIVQKEYVIKSGDTLSALSKQFGVSIEDILKANPQITDPNLIFTGKKLILPGLDTTAPTEDVKKLQNELLEVNAQLEQTAEDQLLRIAKGQESIVENQTQALTQFQQRALALFQESSLFKRLFGEDEFAALRAVQTVGTLEDIFKNIAKSSKVIGAGFGLIFKGKFKSGLKEIVKGFSTLAFEATNLFETITGVDISDELQKNLSEGNIRAIFSSVTSAVGSAVRELFVAAIPFAIQGAGFVLRAFLKGLGGGLRLVGNLLGIDFLNSFFIALDASVIEPVVTKFVDTLKGVFQLASGEISLANFLIDLFGIDTLGDKIGVVLALEEVEDAIDNLKLAFAEFATEAGLDTIDFKALADDLIYFQNNVFPEIVINGIRGVASAINFFAQVVGRAGPVVPFLLEPIERLLRNIGEATKDIDEQQLKDIGLGILAITAPLIALAAISLLGPLLAIGAGFLAIYFAVNILAEVVDPVLSFLENLGQLVDAVADGDFDRAAKEIKELFQDFEDFNQAVTVGTINAFIGLFDAIGKLTGLDLSSVTRTLELVRSLVEGDTEAFASFLSDTLGQEIANFILGANIVLTRFKITLLQAVEVITLGITGLLNSLIDAVNKVTGSDITLLDEGFGISDEIAKAEAELATLENTQHIIQMTIEFQQTGELPDFIENIFSQRDFGNKALPQFIRNSLFAGVTGDEIGQAIEDSITAGDFDSADINSVLLNSLSSGSLTAEEIKTILPPDLATNFEQALVDNINAGFGGEKFKNALDVFNNEETSTFIKDAGKNLMAGLGLGITENENLTKDATTTAMQNVKAAVATELETNSPSRFTARQGMYLMEGLRDGIVNNFMLVQGAVLSATQLFTPLVESIRMVEIQVGISFTNAAISMESNVTLMQAAISRLIGSLMYLATIAGAALQSVTALSGVSVSVPNVPSATRTSGTTTSAPPPITSSVLPTVPRSGGGAIGDMNASIRGATRGNAPVGKGIEGNGGNTTVSYQFGDINITNANPNQRITPEDIARGIRLYGEQNPPSRRMRNKT